MQPVSVYREQGPDSRVRVVLRRATFVTGTLCRALGGSAPRLGQDWNQNHAIQRCIQWFGTYKREEEVYKKGSQAGGLQGSWKL